MNPDVKMPRMDCAIDATMSVIEGRWKTVVLCKLAMKKKMRFNQMIKEIEGISPRILSKQLRELERDGVILRTSFPEIPPRVEYTLTKRGESLIPLLVIMGDWGLRNMFPNLVKFKDISVDSTESSEEVPSS
ncbi:MAG: helix-turn-helix domain-containing protein [Candidatus Methanomethylophilaceae archaeon]